MKIGLIRRVSNSMPYRLKPADCCGNQHFIDGSKSRPKNRMIIPPFEFRQISRLKLWSTILMLFIISIVLNTVGLKWGQPAGYSWHPDSIAGKGTAIRIHRLFNNWNSKYPKGHYLIASAFYQLHINKWDQNPYEVKVSPEQINSESTIVQKRSRLILVSRIISALMGAFAVVLVFLSGRLLFNDYLAGLLSALAMAFFQDFVLYAHLGNLDVPATFWFALALYLGINVVYVGKWHHYILFGFSAAYAVCTKDPTVGFIIGLALAMWVALTGRGINEQNMPLKKSVLLILNRRTLVGFLIAVLVFMVLNDLFFSPQSFIRRMGHWIGGPGIENCRLSFKGHWPLLKNAFWGLYYSLGWPMLLIIIISLIYCAIYFRWKIAFVILPLLAFYLIIIVYIKFTINRYYIPCYTTLALCVGIFFADLIRSKKLPAIIKILPLGGVYILSLFYCIGLNLELIHDSRYQAEKWLITNVKPKTVIVGMASRSYSPRLESLYSKTFFINDRPNTEMALKKIPSNAEYLILSEKAYANPKAFDQDFLRRLLAGELGFSEVARFENRFLWPKKTIWGIAGWPQRRYRNVSPNIIILKKMYPSIDPV